MPDQFVALREFEGFAKAMREEFRSLSGKIDLLLEGRIEEARVHGELAGTIRSITERLDHYEGDTKLIRTEIDKLWEKHISTSENKLGWVRQLAMLVIAAMVGAFFGRR